MLFSEKDNHIKEWVNDMANTYKVIDEQTWERAMHCAVFRNSIEPAFCVTFEVDVTSFLDGQVVLFDRIDTAFTYLNKETELFKVVNVPMADTLEEYVKLAAKIAMEQKEYFTGPLGNDVFQCSPMPFLTYTHISHTNSGKKDNATPLFDWGKYYEKNGRMVMPVSVQVHHSFVDGIHIGQFAEKLQKYLNEF